MTDPTTTTTPGTCEVDVTYQTGKTDEFREVTNYNNDGASLRFNGRRKDPETGDLGPESEWFIPIAGNVQSVAKRDTPDATI